MNGFHEIQILLDAFFLLALIYALMRNGKLGPPGPAGRDGSPPAHVFLGNPPPSTGHGTWRVMHWQNGGWVPGDWVQEGTEAYRQAFDTPGLALQPETGGPVEMGKQN